MGRFRLAFDPVSDPEFTGSWSKWEASNIFFSFASLPAGNGCLVGRMKECFSSRWSLTAVLFLLSFAVGREGVGAEVGEDNPNGVAGDYNGSITTAGHMDPLTGNAKRVIDDITVPGSVGAYPLKWSRYLNTRGIGHPAFGGGGAWNHSYGWGLTILPPLPPPNEWEPTSYVVYPDGHMKDLYQSSEFYVAPLPGRDQVHERVLKTGGGDYGLGYYDLLLGDGGRVHFEPVPNVGLAPVAVVDPYGLTTTLTYVSGRLDKITAPGGRFLKINYNSTDLIGSVQAYDRVGGTVIETVNYTYTLVSGVPDPYYKLTGVDYSDGTHAAYTYEANNGRNGEYHQLVSTCDDVRYNGPMRQIKYQYLTAADIGGATRAPGQIKAEKNKVTGETVTEITYPDSGITGSGMYKRTETRGDGQTRDFQYGEYPEPFRELTRVTDFQGHSTNISFSGDINSGIHKTVTDARGYITSTDRDENGLITKITHPGGAYVEYAYINTYYLYTRRNELGKVTTHTRDVKNRIIRTDYPTDVNTPASFEEFSYNDFNQVLTHHLKNGKYQHFQYDTRGLLAAKWNPTPNATPVGTDPKTTYTYYTAADGKPGWIDRVKTETLPANVSGLQASETYEYDKNASDTAVAGRGLVTKITHADGKYQAFDYDNYGNKLWEENELRQRTTYVYDAYKRLLSAKNPLLETTTYSYEATNGGNTSANLHTTSSVRFQTSPTGIKTANVYDENFRKISTTQAYGTGFAATTTFEYDEVGNLEWITDPLGHKTFSQYDSRNRKTSTTEAYGTTVALTTAWAYDPASNVIRIARPDLSTEYKFYDALNRVYLHMVPRLGTPQAPTEYTNTQFTFNPSATIASVSDPRGKVTSFEYDASDRRTKMIYPGATYQQWTYDDAGNLSSRRTVSGKTQSFTYDVRNRKTEMRWSDTAEWAQFGYDDASRLISAKNGTGAWLTNVISTVTRTYDSAGRLTLDRQDLNGLGAAKDVNYVYDDDGKATRMYVTGASYDYTFSYDLMGRFEKILPTGGSPSFQYYYDAASNETQRYNFLNGGATQIYTRDSLNRMSRRDVKKGATTLSYEVYGFDPMSRLSSVTREDGKQDRFTYYLDGELNGATYGADPTPTPSPPPPTPTPTPTPTPGRVAEPTFSPPGYNYYPQTSIAPWISTTTTGAKICWTSDGTTPTSNGSTCTHGTLISGSGGSAPCSPFYEGTLKAIAFKSGMLDSVVHSEYYWRDSGMNPDTTRTLTYNLDRAGNRTSIVDDGGMSPDITRIVTYNLDRAGNRTSIVDSGVTKTYAPNDLNQYTSAEGVVMSNGSEHEVSEYQGVAYTYRNDERLIRATSGPDAYDLAYDALDRCVKRTLNGATTYYIYDGEKPILEYNSTGAIVGRNFYGKGIDENLMRTDPSVNGGAAFYYQQDRNGNVTHLTNASGAIIEKYKYDAFGVVRVYDGSGNLRPDGTAFNNRFLFTGREYAATYAGTYVPAFTFYEYRARAYNPVLGRFMSEDPKGFDAGDYNLFRYCHNNPLDMTDPMGLEAGGPQSGDTPQIGPAVVLPIGSNIPVLAVRLANAQWVDYRAAGLTMGQVSQSGPKMFTYSLKSRYNIGDLSGARGFQYVWDPNEKFSGQCMTTVQHCTGAPESSTPLLRGAAVGPNTRRGTAVATGFEVNSRGQWVYPSKPTGNHAAMYVASLGRGIMQTLEAQKGEPLHLDKQSMAGWYEVTSRLPPVSTSTSELRPWTGPVPW
jgi:RHS repeat-associated protein